MKHSLVRVIVSTAALLLAGCATTPPEVKAVVGDTTAMLAQLQQELQRFRTARAASDERILELSRDIQLSAAEDQQFVNRTLLTLEATGSADAVVLFGRLKALAQGLKANDDALQALRQDLDIELAALVKPLPNSTAKLRAATSAISGLGQDLSSKTQLEEALATLRSVRDNTKANVAKLKTASTQ